MAGEEEKPSLSKILSTNPEVPFEIVEGLLREGADPLEKYCMYNAFEWSVMRNHSPRLQELVFNNTFNETVSSNVLLHILVELAKKKSPLFHRIFSYKVNVINKMEMCPLNLPLNRWVRYPYRKRKRSTTVEAMFIELFKVDVDYLEVLLRQCNNAIYGLIRETVTHSFPYKLLSDDQAVTKLNLFMQSSPAVRDAIQVPIRKLTFPDVWTQTKKKGEDFVSNTLIFLIAHGLKLSWYVYYSVLEEFGYCELFKTLVHMDVPQDSADSSHVLHFGFIQKSENRTSGVSTLVELARTTVQKHLMKCYGVTSLRQFCKIVERLPVPNLHKKIIMIGE